MSETARARLDNIFHRICHGTTVTEVWVFYPRGKPKSCRTRFSGVMVNNDKMIFMCEAQQMESVSADEMLRGAEAVKYVDAFIALWTRDGTSVMRNPAASQLLGSVEHANQTGKLLKDYFLDPAEADDVFQRMEKEGWASKEVQLKTLDGRIVWAALDVRLTQDPSTGEATILTHAKDLTERREVEIELIRAREEAEAATKAKSLFLASISHEMRTPMSAIKAGLELLRASNLDQDQLTLLNRMSESSELLITLLNDVLEWTKIGSGNYTTEIIAFDVHRAIRTVCDLLLPKAASKGIKVSCVIDKTVPVGISTDPTRLRQILFNLIGNAVKFCEKGRIDVRCDLIWLNPDDVPENGSCFSRPPAVPVCETGRQYLRIQVEDTGIGMTAAHMKNLFKSFSQADTTTTRRFGGSGLGLAISHALVALLGDAAGGRGSLSVTSNLGIGSTFTVYLPFVPTKEDCEETRLLESFDGEHDQRTLAQTTSNGVMSELVEGEEEASSNASLTHGLKQMSLSAPRKRFSHEEKIISASFALDPPVRVLLVEDNAVLQIIVGKMLRKMGHWVNVSADGLDSLSAMERGYRNEGDGDASAPYDIVLMDRSMPRMDGPTAAKRIREMPRVGAVPIVVLTADVMCESDDAFKGCAVDDICTKPIDFAKLNAKIVKLATAWRLRAP